MTTVLVSKSVQQRITATLFVSQSLFSAATIASFTLTPIIAAQLSGNDSAAGVPSTMTLLGRAVIAYPIGWLMDRAGRRLGLSVGYLLGMLGMALTVLSVMWGSFVWFLMGMTLFGMGRGTSEQGRFVAADVYTAEQRAKVIGLIVFAGTIGAVGGPLLVEPSGRLAIGYGLDEPAGPYVAATLLISLALVLIFAFLRPDPIVIGHSLTMEKQDESVAERRPLSQIFATPTVMLAVATMAIGQLVMTFIMVITPLHMNQHGYGTQSIALVIMAHTLGMFGLSGLTGWLVDKYGRIPMILVGAFVLVISSLLTPQSTGAPLLAFALFLLGLGWNFCFVAGSSLLSDTLAAGERGRVQGASEMIVALASGAGSLGTGIVFAQGGIITVSGVGLAFSLALMSVVALFVRLHRAQVSEINT